MLTDEQVTDYLIDGIPCWHRSATRIESIAYIHEVVPSLGGFITGRFLPQDESRKKCYIEMYRQANGDNISEGLMWHTLCHEIGHSQYWQMPSGLQSRWAALHQQTPANLFVSVVVPMNEREDFAENYAHYLREPHLVEWEATEKYHFLRKFIFGGREYMS